MFKYIPGTIGFLCLTTIGAEVQAQTVENNVNSESQPNQAQTLGNKQNNAAAINQTSIFNLGSSATYKIEGLGGRQVVCPRPSLIVGSGYNFADGINFRENSSYAISASVIFPLGGKIGKTCSGMANTIARKTQVDFEISNARSCTTLINTGISLNPLKFPTIFDVCQGISLAKNDAVLFDRVPKFKAKVSPQAAIKNSDRHKSKQLKANNFRNRKDYLNSKRRRRRDDY